MFSFNYKTKTCSGFLHVPPWEGYFICESIFHVAPQHFIDALCASDRHDLLFLFRGDCVDLLNKAVGDLLYLFLRVL